jgi:Domain of unknown function (DUF397)
MLGPWRKSSYSGDESACVELAWRKSTFSADESNCVELGWRKSSHSTDGHACVEVASAGAIRDSKNPDGGHLEVPLAGLIALAKRD